MKLRGSEGGRSFNAQLIASFMGCMSLLLAFVAISLISPLSELLENNAIDRTKETVLQSVSAVDIFVEKLLSTLYFSTTALPDSLDDGADIWVSRMELIKQSNSDIISVELFHQDGSLLGATGGGSLRVPAEEIAQEEWFR